MIHTTRVHVLGAFAAAVGALALAATAFAAPPPKPADPTIDFDVSLGGVRVGQTLADAQAAWGVTPDCSNQGGSQVCEYGSYDRRGYGRILANDGAVLYAQISVPVKNGKSIFKGPLLEFGTPEGDLGLGDTLDEVAARYPGGKERGRALNYSEGGNRLTFFAAHLNVGRITSIGIATKNP